MQNTSVTTVLPKTTNERKKKKCEMSSNTFTTKAIREKWADSTGEFRIRIK